MQPQETESHPIPALKPGHPQQFSPRTVRATHGQHTAQLLPAAHPLGDIPLRASSWAPCSAALRANRLEQGTKAAVRPQLQRQSGDGGTGEGSCWAKRATAGQRPTSHNHCQLCGAPPPTDTAAGAEQLRQPHTALPRPHGRPPRSSGCCRHGEARQCRAAPWVPRCRHAAPRPPSPGTRGNAVWGRTDQESSHSEQRPTQTAEYLQLRTHQKLHIRVHSHHGRKSLWGTEQTKKEGQCRARVADTATSSPASAAGIS